MRPLLRAVLRRPSLPVLVSMAAAAVVGGCQTGELEAVPASGADTYGDDAVLDRLWVECDGGAEVACDDLYWSSPVGSRYERFSVER